jgi:outer membrane protein OmpA-like peptidoglycan-associated protein
MTNLSFKYALNKYSDLKFEQLTWQEGHFFDSDQEIILADSIGIKDVVYGFMYENINKTPYNFGFRSRSIKSFSLIFGIQIFKNIHTQLSYELPLRKDLDNPTQMGISFIYIDKKKKRSVDLPAVASFGDSVFLNENDFTKVVNVHDTIFVYKNDTVLVYTNNETENGNVVKSNSVDENEIIQKPAIKNEAVLNDSIKTSSNLDVSIGNQLNNEIANIGMIDSTKNANHGEIIVSNINESSIKQKDSAFQLDNKLSRNLNHDSDVIVQNIKLQNSATPIKQDTNSDLADIENSQPQIDVSNKVSNDPTSIPKTQKENSKKSIQLVANKFTIEKRELTNVYFEFNKSTLSDSSKLIIDQFISTQKIKPGVKLLVEGFCDDVGTESHNLKLSKSRAVSVKKYLIAKGIDKKIISLIHFGKTFKTLSDADRWKYRKSVIVLID